MRAVIECAEHCLSAWVGGRHHQGVARSRAAYIARCKRSNSAGEGAGNRLPATIWLAGNHANGNAVCRLAFTHFLCGPGRHPAGVEQAIVGVFMVHHPQAFGRIVALLGEKSAAVMVHTKLALLFGSAITGV